MIPLAAVPSDWRAGPACHNIERVKLSNLAHSLSCNRGQNKFCCAVYRMEDVFLSVLTVVSALKPKPGSYASVIF